MLCGIMAADLNAVIDGTGDMAGKALACHKGRYMAAAPGGLIPVRCLHFNIFELLLPLFCKSEDHGVRQYVIEIGGIFIYQGFEHGQLGTFDELTEAQEQSHLFEAVPAVASQSSTEEWQEPSTNEDNGDGAQWDEAVLFLVKEKVEDCVTEGACTGYGKELQEDPHLAFLHVVL